MKARAANQPSREIRRLGLAQVTWWVGAILGPGLIWTSALWTRQGCIGPTGIVIARAVVVGRSGRLAGRCSVLFVDAEGGHGIRSPSVLLRRTEY